MERLKGGISGPARQSGVAPGSVLRPPASFRSDGARPPLAPDRRRSLRVKIIMPVLIYGWLDAEPFQEITETLSVNAHGGLIRLGANVARSQRLILTNLRTMEELPCTVIQLGRADQGKTHVGIEFLEPSPRFWGIHFPPEDWDPSERKLPQVPGPISSHR